MEFGNYILFDDGSGSLDKIKEILESKGINYYEFSIGGNKSYVRPSESKNHFLFEEKDFNELEKNLESEVKGEVI
jgi:hypothetical protein